MSYVETPITSRQLDVGRLCDAGLTNDEIAVQLGISTRVVKTMTNELRRKLNVSRKRLIGPALRERGLL